MASLSLYLSNIAQHTNFTSWQETHSWQRVPSPPILWRLPYMAYLFFFQILPTPPPTTNPTALFVALFLWLNEWSCNIWCVASLNGLIHMSNLGTLVPESPCCVFYATRRQVYWGLTNNVVFLLVLWLDAPHTHTKKTDSTHRGQETDTLI